MSAERQIGLESAPPTMNVRQLFDLTGRTAIITGGSIGLGRQMAEGLAEMGANLVSALARKSVASRLPPNCRASE